MVVLHNIRVSIEHGVYFIGICVTRTQCISRCCNFFRNLHKFMAFLERKLPLTPVFGGDKCVSAS